MKIMILGADGMLGHQLVQSYRGRHEAIGTYRKSREDYTDISDYLADSCHYGIEASNFNVIGDLIAKIKPDAVINAIGIVKQRAESKELISSIEINALLPHKLALYCQEAGARLVHLSTDCVFSGSRGMYQETDFADADDVYGRTKLLGEVADSGCITLRTSIIGLELSRKKSLIEWFLAQKGRIQGFRNAIYSGFTTLEMARVIEMLLVRYPAASGLYHLSSEPISKYELLAQLNALLGNRLDISENTDFKCERSMRSDRFRTDFDYTPPTWPATLEELATQIKERYQWT